MSTSPDDALDPSTVGEQALAALRGKGNPFEVLVRPQRVDETFAEIHVPAFQQSEREQLLAMVDWYRLPDYQERESLRPTRVVTVRGARGSGKTHLLQSLLARPEGRPQ